MEVKSIALNYGHTATGAGSGAIGVLNESNENRRLGKRVKALLEQNGIKVYDATVDRATSSSAYLQEAVKKANSQAVDLAVSIHFNCANDPNANGTETLIYSNTSKAKDLANRVNSKLTGVGFRNRGVKVYSNLYWLKTTNAPSILIETCFVSSKKDADLYNKEFEKTAIAIVEGITGRSINTGNTSGNTGATTNGNTYRIYSDSTHIGSYSVTENTLAQVKKLVENGIKDIRLEKI